MLQFNSEWFESIGVIEKRGKVQVLYRLLYRYFEYTRRFAKCQGEPGKSIQISDVIWRMFGEREKWTDEYYCTACTETIAIIAMRAREKAI